MAPESSLAMLPALPDSFSGQRGYCGFNLKEV
jgi:hypothetical protein